MGDRERLNTQKHTTQITVCVCVCICMYTHTYISSAEVRIHRHTDTQRHRQTQRAVEGVGSKKGKLGARKVEGGSRRGLRETESERARDGQTLGARKEKTRLREGARASERASKRWTDRQKCIESGSERSDGQTNRCVTGQAG